MIKGKRAKTNIWSSSSKALSEPDEATQLNSTGIEGRPMVETIQESTIEKDFESTFDDSFILRTKPMQMESSESGFRSQNTFSFGETDSDGSQYESGMMRLLKMDKQRKGNYFRCHVMEKKVILKVKRGEIMINLEGGINRPRIRCIYAMRYIEIQYERCDQRMGLRSHVR